MARSDLHRELLRLAENCETLTGIGHPYLKKIPCIALSRTYTISFSQLCGIEATLVLQTTKLRIFHATSYIFLHLKLSGSDKSHRVALQASLDLEPKANFTLGLVQNFERKQLAARHAWTAEEEEIGETAELYDDATREKCLLVTHQKGEISLN